MLFKYVDTMKIRLHNFFNFSDVTKKPQFP